MPWVRQAPTLPQPHTCKPPRREILGGLIEQAVGTHGDLWRCDHCDILWQIRDAFNTNGPEWRHAGWWSCWRYRKAGRESRPPASSLYSPQRR